MNEAAAAAAAAAAVTLQHWKLQCTPDICHRLTDGVRGEKICHVEKFLSFLHRHSQFIEDFILKYFGYKPVLDLTD